MAVCLALGAMACAYGSAASDAEDALRSAAVWGFLRYSDWPPSGDGANTVGVVGRGAFLQTLRRTLEGKAVKNRPVRVVEYAADPHCCQLIYFATGRAADARAVLQTLPERVLTIGEDERFLDCGGVVNLFIDDGHIAFETSLDALNKSGIPISSSLLRLGQIRDRGKAKVLR